MKKAICELSFGILAKMLHLPSDVQIHSIRPYLGIGDSPDSFCILLEGEGLPHQYKTEPGYELMRIAPQFRILQVAVPTGDGWPD